MIIATAGHVDHGKTSLVRALTGVDADRLPEEKKRGLTIDLGFAYDDGLADGETVGFVDVPGHEKFIHNMLAGVTAIRAALLVIAADDGPMPQTREHLDILDLVGVGEGIVALTKTDLVEPARRDEVTAAIGELLAPTRLSGAPIFPVSSTTGDGVPDLAVHIAELAEATAPPPDAGNFRLAVDRVFTLQGAGLVVTGLVRSGSVRVGDQLLLSPAGTPVRVRGLRAQDREAEAAVAGDRCALNLAGSIDRESVGRGDWVVAPAAHLSTRRLDAEIRVLPGEARPLRHWTPVHVHLGTADITGRVALLAEKHAEPGETALAQLVLDRPVHAAGGDAVVLRDQSARRTIGGGRILDPVSPARGRSRPDRMAWVQALTLRDQAPALADIVEAAPAGAALHALRPAWNLTDQEFEEILSEVDVVCRGDSIVVGFTQAAWDARLAEIVAAVDQWHADRQDSPGANHQAIRRALPHRLPEPAFEAAAAALVASGRLERAGALLRKPGASAQLTPADDRLWQQIRDFMDADEGKPPTIFETAEELGIDKGAAQRLLARATKVGLTQRVSANRYMTTAVLSRLAGQAEAAAREADDGFTVAAFRDRSGMGRNLSIEILEFFDRVGFTRRRGNAREVLKPAARVFGGAEDT